MSAFAVNRDAYRVRIRVIYTRSNPDDPSRENIAHVQSDDGIGLGKARKQAVSEHRLGPANGLFGGLANQDKCSVPSILAVRHNLSSAEQGSHVHIVPAGVHHGNIDRKSVV